MSVSLICMPLPQILKEGSDNEYLSPEEFLAYVARVSNPGNQANYATGPKLIKSLIRDHHWSPLEMVSITLEINTTRDIARQILRHRSFSFQEFSQRYAEVDISEQKRVYRTARMQDSKNRQNSIETENQDLIDDWDRMQYAASKAASAAYSWAIRNGIAKEVARAVLPEGITPSRMYMAGTLRSWIHYCQLRMANGTQLEHQRIAKQCWEVISEKFPSIKELVENIE